LVNPVDAVPEYPKVEDTVGLVEKLDAVFNWVGVKVVMEELHVLQGPNIALLLLLT